MFVEHIVSKIVFYVIYQTRKTVFDHISKHREGSWKYDAQRSILTNFEVFGNVVKHCLECLKSITFECLISIESKTKEKNGEIKS